MHSQSDSRMTPVLIAFLAIGAALIVWEHRAHAAGVALYALLLVCPLLHVFLHRGHRHGPGGSR